MPTGIVERLGAFLAHKRLNHSDLARELGYKSSEKISRLFRKAGTLPSAEIITDIANKFAKELNIEWWITGEGEMLKANNYIRQVPPDGNEPAYLRKRKKSEMQRLLHLTSDLKNISKEIEDYITSKEK